MKKLLIVLFAALMLSGCFDPSAESTQETQNIVKNIDVNLSLNDVQDLLVEIYKDVSPGIIGVSSVQDNTAIGTGSAVVYKRDEEGYYYAVTNNHVVENGNKVYAYINDTDSYIEATLLGTDYKTDLAVFKFKYDGETLPIIQFGDYDTVQTGQFAIAIGNPLGYDLYGTMTFGIISSASRVMDVDTDNDGVYDWNSTYLQTDAALSPGNSGGALLDLSGKLIGINTMKYTYQDSSNLGFAIPINTVKTVIQDLEQYGEYRRPLLGITAIDVKNILNAPGYNVPSNVDDGVYVVDVTSGSDAEDAGMKIGDIITEFNGTTITGMDDLRKAIDMTNVGDTVSVSYYRDGNLETTNILLDSYR